MSEKNLNTEPLFIAKDLKQHYTISNGLFKKPSIVRALDGISFEIEAGKTLSVVGESGCGKSTLARQITLVETPTAGERILDGVDITAPSDKEHRDAQTQIQMIFQNPYSSLNPRKTIGQMLEEPLLLNTNMSAAERREKAGAMLEKTGLRREHLDRYPHMFSGGQRQRIAIARALMLNPKLVVADEPVSALDVSVQAQVLNLMMDLQDELGVAFLFISHDLSVVEQISDRILVMYLGKLVEEGDKETIFANPVHPYTRSLMASTPQVDPSKRKDKTILPGELPSPLNPPPGCPFHTRCPFATDLCKKDMPEQRMVEGRKTACHHAEKVAEIPF